MTSDYKKLFDPASSSKTSSTGKASTQASIGDRAGPGGYVYSDDIVLAINVALASGRPLLVRGPSGTGKSSLARSVASELEHSFFEIVVTARTEAHDFLLQIDHLRRLRDAQTGGSSIELLNYAFPGPLFWGFDPAKAKKLLDDTKRSELTPKGFRADAAGATILVDEIDKADPDVPNSLLGPLGQLAFDLPDLGLTVAAEKPPLVIITTNEERDLPAAFLRRCVELEIDAPGKDTLVRIGKAHMPDADGKLLEHVADMVDGYSTDSGRAISAAEYLDTVRTCQTLGIDLNDNTLQSVAVATLWKQDRKR